MKKVRIGIFGAGRGADLAKNFMLLNCDIVAICDVSPERIQNGMKKNNLHAGIKTFHDFDSFLDCGLDAVILANAFHEHAPYILKCMEKGIHIFCECVSNGTMAEGVELVRAAKNSKSIFMLAENYPQMRFNREMQRICRTGSLGKILFAEGEYNHPSDPLDVQFKKEYNYFPHHWRNFNPRTYYITHSLAPLMCATGATPRRVTAFACFAPPGEEVPTASFVGDKAAIITMQNDDGSVFRVTGCAAFGAHDNSYRICGTNGQIENLRGMDGQVMLRYNSWSVPEGEEETKLYTPGWNDKDEDLINQSGHGGGDYLTARMFLECIQEGKQPSHPFDLHAAIAMSSVGILAHRSMLEGGKPYEIPDFSREADCRQYENDRLSPMYGFDGSEPTLPCCSVTDYAPTQTQQDAYWKLLGIEV